MRPQSSIFCAALYRSSRSISKRSPVNADSPWPSANARYRPQRRLERLQLFWAGARVQRHLYRFWRRPRKGTPRNTRITSCELSKCIPQGYGVPGASCWLCFVFSCRDSTACRDRACIHGRRTSLISSYYTHFFADHFQRLTHLGTLWVKWQCQESPQGELSQGHYTR